MFRPTSFFAAILATLCLLFGSPAFAMQEQVKPPPKPVVLAAPEIAANTTADFQHAVLAVELALDAEKFDEAKSLAARLPRRFISVSWDDANVPPSLKPAFEAARGRAIEAWRQPTTLEFRVVPKSAPADIRFSFQLKLNTAANADGPPGVVTLIGEDPVHPTFEAVIGLKRTARLSPTTDLDVAADVAYAVGVYCGLSSSPSTTSFMHHSNGHASNLASGDPVDFAAADRNFSLARQLQTWAEKKQRVLAGLAKAVADPLKIAPATPVLQGNLLNISIQVTNTGQAPMATAVRPDCNCFSSSPPKDVAPGESVIYSIQMATIIYGGAVDKTLYLLTSDPDQPLITIPVHVYVTPRYQFIVPGGSMVLLDHSGTEVAVYLAVNGPDLNPNGARLEGVQGAVSFAPWQGTLADPLLGEPAKPRKGYKFTIDIGDIKLIGREIMSLVVDTEDPVFRQIRNNLWLQDGLIVAPSPVNLGHLAPVRREFSKIVDISLGEKPFHVIGLKCDNPHLTVTQFQARPGEHVLSIIYDGKASAGDLFGTITVTTDYPDQRVLKIPVQGVAD